MTPERLLEMIKGGESLDVEFKGEKGKRLSDRELIEAAVCLANRASTDNGWLSVGVEDKRKGRAWHLSAAVWHRMGERAAYVRQRGFEPLQQEQMVLQYVDTHGCITRREAAELCQISGHQAYRLLDKLFKAGRLAREGARGRGVVYQKNTK